MRLRYKLGAGGIILGIAFLAGKCSKKPVENLPLPPGIVKKIIVDPKHKFIKIIDEKGTKKITLPPGPSEVEIGKNGETKIIAPQLGLEFQPFGGFGYSDGGAVILGLDLLYWKRLDLGAGFLVRVNPNAYQTTAAALTVSYSIISNTRVTCSVSPTGAVGAFVTVRF